MKIMFFVLWHIIFSIINIVIEKIINKELNISPSTITLWNKKYHTFIQNKSYLDLNIYQQIKSSKLHNSNKSNKYVPIIIDYVNKNEGCSLKNIKNEINNSLSSYTICRLLKNNNITKKKIINNTIYKSIEDIDKDRIKFVKDLTKDQFYNLISTDESHFNINQVKNYGYSKKGNVIIKWRKT